MDLAEARLVALVAAGGAIGSVARYGVSGFLTRGDFPWGTFAVNLTGTFLLSLLFFVSLGRGFLSSDARTFLFVGVFGGYTTFSTFGLETVELVRAGTPALGALNFMLNAGVCLGGAFLGAVLGLWLGGGGGGA
jgi:fluoride exporter